MFNISEELKKLPEKPGVYIMKDDLDNIIYIGKAINLKNRVRQYFQNSKNQLPKVKSMVKYIKSFEYIITDSEMEALILECTLIKKHRPKYNIALKDDKMYPYIKITLNEDFPRIFITHTYIKDKAKYYGPITDSYAVKETIDIIHKVWAIRKCKKVFPRDLKKERPCLNYHIGQCEAPCYGLISKEQYRKIIDEIMMFIEGKHDDILKRMKKEMFESSEKFEFEKAALLRDKIKSIESISQKQKMENNNMADCDIIAFVRDKDNGLAQIFFIRSGKVTGREHFFLNNIENLSKNEIMTEFIKQFYSGTAFVPKEILIETDVISEEKELIEKYLSELRGSKVNLLVPKKGEKLKLIEMVSKNASISFAQFGEIMKKEEQRTKGALEEIKILLEIENNINRIEAFDISNIQGVHSVASMIVFEDGKAKHSDYRKFKIKSVLGANDYESMKEVITRRFNRAILEKNIDEKDKKFAKLPDLIMMDGGKIQVHAAENIISEFGFDIPVCGMVKDDKHKTRGIIYKDKELYMPYNSEGFKLITRIQDEVHRFAIEYHRKLHEKVSLHSVLDDIEGIGEKRKKALLRYFGSIEEIKKASIKEIVKVDGMNIKVAESVYRFFRK